jgi:hypothetical protein
VSLFEGFPDFDLCLWTRKPATTPTATKAPTTIWKSWLISRTYFIIIMVHSPPAITPTLTPPAAAALEDCPLELDWPLKSDPELPLPWLTLPGTGAPSTLVEPTAALLLLIAATASAEELVNPVLELGELFRPNKVGLAFVAAAMTG